jgi:hypothetical protein
MRIGPEATARKVPERCGSIRLATNAARYSNDANTPHAASSLGRYADRRNRKKKMVEPTQKKIALTSVPAPDDVSAASVSSWLAWKPLACGVR